MVKKAQEIKQDMVEFETWYSMRSAQIPKQHHKEILKADFKGRGLRDMEAMETFDEALKKYGVSLG